ncbi:MAG: hypothetical protein ACI84C_000820 [Flavobacteriales bacterium]|jgi:hypothetical protein
MRTWKLACSVYIILLLGLMACTKEIIIDVPTVPSTIVVEGSIENGQAPFVILTRTQGYFEPTDINALQDMFIKGATVTVSSLGNTILLDELCTADLPEELLPLVAEQAGINIETLLLLDICVYTSLNPASYGQENTVYNLLIEVDGEVLTSSTKINTVIELDSVWYATVDDSLGFAFANLSDPDTAGNAYRWFAKRINTYPAWSENAGDQKDGSYIAPLGSSFTDEFFNGLSFEFAYFRGELPNSTKEDDINEERGFFKVGDTIAVKSCVIDRGVYKFFSSFENQAGNQGSPLAVPANVKSNIDGGLGVWVGYGVSYDTIVCAY